MRWQWAEVVGHNYDNKQNKWHINIKTHNHGDLLSNLHITINMIELMNKYRLKMFFFEKKVRFYNLIKKISSWNGFHVKNDYY